MKTVGSADCVKRATVLTSGKVPALAILAMLAPGRLRVAPGGSAPPIPYVARRGPCNARSGQESRLVDETEKPVLRYRGSGKLILQCRL